MSTNTPQKSTTPTKQPNTSNKSPAQNGGSTQKFVQQTLSTPNRQTQASPTNKTPQQPTNIPDQLKNSASKTPLTESKTPNVTPKTPAVQIQLTPVSNMNTPNSIVNTIKSTPNNGSKFTPIESVSNITPIANTNKALNTPVLYNGSPNLSEQLYDDGNDSDDASGRHHQDAMIVGMPVPRKGRNHRHSSAMSKLNQPVVSHSVQADDLMTQPTNLPPTLDGDDIGDLGDLDDIDMDSGPFSNKANSPDVIKTVNEISTGEQDMKLSNSSANIETVDDHLDTNCASEDVMDLVDHLDTNYVSEDVMDFVNDALDNITTGPLPIDEIPPADRLLASCMRLYSRDPIMSKYLSLTNGVDGHKWSNYGGDRYEVSDNTYYGWQARSVGDVRKLTVSSYMSFQHVVVLNFPNIASPSKNKLHKSVIEPGEIFVIRSADEITLTKKMPARRVDVAKAGKLGASKTTKAKTTAEKPNTRSTSNKESQKKGANKKTTDDDSDQDGSDEATGEHGDAKKAKHTTKTKPGKTSNKKEEEVEEKETEEIETDDVSEVVSSRTEEEEEDEMEVEEEEVEEKSEEVSVKKRKRTPTKPRVARRKLSKTKKSTNDEEKAKKPKKGTKKTASKKSSKIEEPKEKNRLDEETLNSDDDEEEEEEEEEISDVETPKKKSKVSHTSKSTKKGSKSKKAAEDKESKSKKTKNPRKRKSKDVDESEADEVEEEERKEAEEAREEEKREQRRQKAKEAKDRAKMERVVHEITEAQMNFADHQLRVCEGIDHSRNKSASNKYVESVTHMKNYFACYLISIIECIKKRWANVRVESTEGPRELENIEWVVCALEEIRPGWGREEDCNIPWGPILEILGEQYTEDELGGTEVSKDTLLSIVNRVSNNVKGVTPYLIGGSGYDSFMTYLEVTKGGMNTSSMSAEVGIDAMDVSSVSSQAPITNETETQHNAPISQQRGDRQQSQSQQEEEVEGVSVGTFSFA